MKRALVLLVTAALMLAAATPVSAASEGHGYLALGDSVAFGTNPLVNPSDATRFSGYPDVVAQQLNVESVNAACPGEATGGFISPTGLDNVCRPYRSAFPLHTSYTGTQLAFATSYLAANPRTRLVTINLDANDAFRLAKGGAGTSPWPPSGCYTPSPLAYFSTCAVQNLKTIFAAIRATGYTGLIVALTYYALDYSDPASVGGTQLLNGAMIAAAAPYGVLVASGFDAFRGPAASAGGSACAAGLLIRLSPTTCDVHPTPRGRDLLGAAIVSTIGASCPGDVRGCLDRNRG